MDKIKLQQIEILSALAVLQQVEFWHFENHPAPTVANLNHPVHRSLFRRLEIGRSGGRQRGDVVVNVFIVARGHVGDQIAQLVERQEDHVDHVRIRHQLTIADHVENIFDLVSKILDFGQTQKARPAFDGMRGAKDLVDQLNIDISSGLFDGQKIILDISEVLGGLFHVHL